MTARRRVRTERSAGGVVVRRVDGVVHCLVIRDPYQKWGLPKGHLEPGESTTEAALREVTEETGLDELVSGPELGTVDWYFRNGKHVVHKYCTFFLMGSAQGDATPEREEGITEVRWVPLSDAPDAVSYDNAREVVREAVRLFEQREPPLDV